MVIIEFLVLGKPRVISPPSIIYLFTNKQCFFLDDHHPAHTSVPPNQEACRENNAHSLQDTNELIIAYGPNPYPTSSFLSPGHVSRPQRPGAPSPPFPWRIRVRVYVYLHRFLLSSMHPVYLCLICTLLINPPKNVTDANLNP